MKNLVKSYKQAPKLLGVASNFTYDQDLAGKIRAEGEPRFFEKPVSSIFELENNQKVRIDCPGRVICEIELAVIISKSLKDLPYTESEVSLEHIKGYSLVSDLTCRRIKPISDFPDLFYMKNWENLTPVSRFIEKEEISNPNNVQFKLKIVRAENGEELVLEYNSKDFVWSIEEQLAFVSQRQEWKEDDVLLTGAPVESPQIYNGDSVEATLESDGQVITQINFILQQDSYAGED